MGLCSCLYLYHEMQGTDVGTDRHLGCKIRREVGLGLQVAQRRSYPSNSRPKRDTMYILGALG